LCGRCSRRETLFDSSKDESIPCAITDDGDTIIVAASAHLAQLEVTNAETQLMQTVSSLETASQSGSIQGLDTVNGYTCWLNLRHTVSFHLQSRRRPVACSKPQSQFDSLAERWAPGSWSTGPKNLQSPERSLDLQAEDGIRVAKSLKYKSPLGAILVETSRKKLTRRKRSLQL